MPITNISRINTIDEWRVQTNQSANAVNQIETGNFNKTDGTFTVSETGSLEITAEGTALTVSNTALIQNTAVIGKNISLGSEETATGNLTVGANVYIYGKGTALYVANNSIIDGNLQTSKNITTNNVTANINVNVSGTTQTGNLLVDSIAIITGNTTAGNLTTANVTTTGSLRVSDTTESTSNSSGSVIVSGGVGITKSVYISGNVTVKGDSNPNSEIKILVGDKAANSSGNLFIYAANTANGGTNGSMTIQGNGTITGNLLLGSGQASSSNTTGALIVSGGIGVSANINASDFIALNSLVADNARITANTTGAHFIASGSLVADNARITANATFSETTAVTINATNARISGNANVASVTATGSLVADNARITANATVAHLIASGSLVADNARITANATFSETTAVTINATNARISGNANVASVTASSSMVADNIRTVGTSETASNTTGTLLTAGGLGVSKSAFISGNVTIKGDASGAVNTSVLLAIGDRTSNSSGNIFVYAANTANGGANGSLTVQGNSTVTGNLTLGSGQVSTTTSTGALIVSGGAGVSGNVYAGSLYDNGNRVARTASGTAPITATLSASTGALAISHDTSGVVAATYGDSVNIPAFAVNDRGHITTVTNTPIRSGSTTQTGILQLTDSTSSTSTTTAATPNSVNAALLLGQANTGAANISAFANHVKLTATSQTITGALTISSGLTVGGDLILTGSQLIDSNRIKLMANTKQTLGSGYDYVTVNRVNAVATLEGTADTIKMSGHGFVMGQNVVFANLNSSLTGVSNNTTYRVIVLTSGGSVASVATGNPGTNTDYFKISTQAGYNSGTPASSTLLNFTNDGTGIATDQDNKDAEIRWNDSAKNWELRDVSNLTDATAYSKILTANLISDSLTSTSSDTLASSKAVNTLDGRIVTANTNLKNYVDVANTNMKNYADTTITTANTNLKNYVDVANTNMKNYVDTANTNMKNYVDVANTNLKNYTEATFLPKTGGTISTDLTISGNLTVSGTVTTINTEEIKLADNEIVLNSNLASDTAPSQDAGILINRGSATNVYVRWNETGDYWVANNGLSGNEFRLANTTKYLAEDTNLYYTQGRFDTAFSGKSTTNLAEGTNLYLTSARIRGNVSASNTSVNTTANTTQPIQYDSTNGLFYHANSGVVVSSHGSASQVPVFTVTNTGHITSVTNTNIAIAAAAVTGLAASATTDTSNATNITSGTLAAARLATSGVTAATHGSASQVPVIVVDTYGRITSVTNTSVALSSSTDQQLNSLGVGTSASGTAGEIRATGDITSGYSDDKLKNRLGNIENALDKVSQLAGFYYKPNELAKTLGYNDNVQVGVSAQQVQQVLPEVVVPAPVDSNFLTVQYERMIPLLIEAIKELKSEVDEIKKKI